MELNAVFGPGINFRFLSTVFNELERGDGGSFENPIVLDEEEDLENSPPTTPVSERPTEPPKLPRSCPFRRQI